MSRIDFNRKPPRGPLTVGDYKFCNTGDGNLVRTAVYVTHRSIDSAQNLLEAAVKEIDSMDSADAHVQMYRQIIRCGVESLEGLKQVACEENKRARTGDCQIGSSIYTMLRMEDVDEETASKLSKKITERIEGR
jgi:hypothetical protein